MPHIQKVKSLRCILVNFVAKNIDKFPTESLEKEPGFEKHAEKDYENVPLSFTELPSAVLGDIFIALRRNGKEVYRKFVHLLLLPNLRTADFRALYKSDLCSILPVVARKCPDLTSLVIGGYEYVKFSKNFNFSLFQRFAKLQILKMSNTSTPDNCLGILGSYCKELRKLQVNGCPVTDAGIEELCVIGNAKSIQFLDLRSTKVTVKGVIMALKNLSSLSILVHSLAAQALHEIHKRALENKLSDITKFSLSKISISFFDINYGNWQKFLKSTVFLCPSITQVVLERGCRLWSDGILRELLPLERVESLDIDLSRNVGGLLSFLKERGSYLKHLSTTILHEDYIPLIAQYCPNLRHLSLCSVLEVVLGIQGWHSVVVSPQVRDQRDKPMEQPILKYLEKLELNALPDAMLTESICLLLSSPSLKYVKISNCAIFTDDVLQRATYAHSFSNLQIFEMLLCEFATHKILDILLQNNISNNLSRITLEWAQKEPENFDQIVDKWKKEKEKKRLDVEISIRYEYCYVEPDDDVDERTVPVEYRSEDEETDEDESSDKIII